MKEMCKEYWSGGAGAPHGLRIHSARGGLPGPVCPPSVRSFVTRKKGPKGLQNHWNSIRFIDKSEQAKSLPEALDSSSAKRRFKSGFGTRFGRIFFQKPFSSRSGFRSVKWSQNGPFFTLAQKSSRNASVFALKAWLTFIFDDKCKNNKILDRKRRTRLKKLQRFHFLLFSRTTSKKPSRFTRNFWNSYRRLSSDSNEDRKITFSDKNHKISVF